MSIVVELDEWLLQEAGQASGIAEPTALVERALHQLIRTEAYRSFLADHDIEMDEAEVARTQHRPFYTVETYSPSVSKPTQTLGERQRILDAKLGEIEHNDHLSDEQKRVQRLLAELGGSEPDATAAPRRRFW